MIYDLNILENYVKKGLLRKIEDADLVQYNYSELCNNTNAWDDITLFNRGNIYEKSTGKLIAKAMPKFFNFSQLSEKEQRYFLKHNKFVNTEKMDGCLGILYKYKGVIRYNSRGGFNNYVTETIKRLLTKYNLEKLNEILENNTLNVEVIAPETRVICDYGNEENLYLISAFIDLGDYWQERSCDELDLFSDLTGLCRPKYNNYSWSQLFEWQKTSNYEKEGFVVMIDSIKYSAYERVKIKSEDYLRIAKFKAGLNKHSIWKYMKNDLEQNTDSLNTYLKLLPDELYATAKAYVDELNNLLEEKKKQAYKLAESVEHVDRKDLYAYFKNSNNTFWQVIYKIRDEKSFDKFLIKMIEPNYDFEETFKIMNGRSL